MEREDFEHILLFKTNIASYAGKAAVCTLLSDLQGAEKWTVDTEDEDCVLRIVSHTLRHQQIIDLITHHGYECCELI